LIVHSKFLLWGSKNTTDDLFLPVSLESETEFQQSASKFIMIRQYHAIFFYQHCL